MAEDIKYLIEKIHQDGVKAAEEKAGEIESQAHRRAEEIVEKAEEEAEAIISAAKNKAVGAERSGKASLEQASRDLLLVLRDEIRSILDKVTILNVRSALPPDELSRIVAGLIKEAGSKHRGEIVVTLEKKDLEKIKHGLMRNLSDELKKGLTLKPSGEISGGFTISYDGDKSHYDFTDKGIAEYLSVYLRPELARILKCPAASI